MQLQNHPIRYINEVKAICIITKSFKSIIIQNYDFLLERQQNLIDIQVI